MFNHWKLARRPRLKGPSVARVGPYGWLTRSWVVVLVCLLGFSPSASQGLEYSLGTGDLLRVTVFGHEDLSGEFELDGAGPHLRRRLRERLADARAVRKGR